jgi:VWFA-related protein
MQTKRCLIDPKHIRINRFVALLFYLLVPAACLAQTGEPSETIRVDSDLVDLKISVMSLNPQNTLPELQQKDFLVLEDGQPQEISFFAAADSPFDLVLVLDLSGSTNDKLKLIRNSAKRFVDETRPVDRVSVVTFSDATLVACPLTRDRELLKKSIDDIEKPAGGTRFWDALHYVLSIFRASGNSLRRSAIVVMTDGVDNALPDVYGDGSRTSFDELLTIVRTSQTIVFPIYLDTEKDEVKRNPAGRAAYAIARDQLAELAQACGSAFYRANKLKDLDDVYKQVIGDLSRVYSIGYRPSKTLRDGKWRSISVQIADRHDVIARTKEGYYARDLPN